MNSVDPSIPPPHGADASRLRRRARQLLARFQLPDDALPGSLALSHRRCGKPSCHCADGEGHPLWTLTFMSAGKKRVESIPAEWLDAIRPRVEAGRRFKETAAELLLINAELFGACPESTHPSIPPQESVTAVEETVVPQPQPRPEPAIPPARPVLAEEPTRFLLLEREVEIEYRSQMLAALQRKVDAFAATVCGAAPVCPHCVRPMRRQDTREVTWLARCGWLHAPVPRYRCPPCRYECRPLLDLLGVEPGRISGALARLLAVLATVAPYPLAARLAWQLLGVTISPMGIWRVAQRLGEAVSQHTDALSRYHADSRSIGAPTQAAPAAVVLGVDGCSLGMQVRPKRRHRKAGETLPPLPPVEEGHFREVKTGVLLLPSERVETSPGRRSVVRRFLVTCLGDADAIFARLYAQLRESGWVGAETVVVIVGDGAEWIWNRANRFVRRCEILDFWHALEHAWKFAQLRYGEGSTQADRWVHVMAEDLRAGKVQEVIARLQRLRPKTPELRESLQSLIHYYSENAARMRYDEYLRLGYGIGSGAVESAHKQIVHARFRQAGMRWSEAGARRLLALRLLLLNDNWALLDRLHMVSLA